MTNIDHIPLNCESCAFRNHHLFRYLEPKELIDISYKRITERYKRGSIVYKEGQRMKGFYCVRSGVAKVYKTGVDGKEQIIRFARPGDIIGYRSVISDELACTSVKILSDAELCQLPSDILLELVRSNGTFAVELMKLTCKELEEANSFLTDVAQKTVKERLAEILIHLYEEFGVDEEGVLNINLTREEMSNLVGTATESIIRLLSEFKNLAYLELKGRKIKILDEPGLRKIANF